MVIQDLVKTVLKELREISKTQTVVGDPIKVQAATVIPVSKVSLGFGIGGGEGSEKSSAYEGTGGGISIEPQAFIVVQNEKVELISLKKTGTALGEVVDLVPKVLDRMQKMKKKNKSSSESGEKS
ncbi:sporulation protein [bacterium]|nr:sporulation protein [bacterium]